MQLYSLTLQKSTGIQKAIYGNFSGPKAQEIVVSKVKHIELLKINESNGKLETIASQEVFGIIRSIHSFRFPGNNRDNLVIGSDSGRVVVLGFDGLKNMFVKVHQETYGKTGCRRIVPGQYLACDPKGRAFMISAVEKHKFVYILTRENEKITISSPLEAPKSHTIVFDIVGLDAGYDNAQFAAIESDYGDWQDKDSAVCTGIQTKFLTIYEMDFGLNTVRRQRSDPIHISSHSLLMVPNAPDGPGGVIVLCEDFLHYRGPKNQEMKVPYPKNQGMPADRGAMISSFGFYKQKSSFLYLLQSEYGDLFELSLQFTKDEVHSIRMIYFDTIPVANSLCLMRSKHLFAACEKGNHCFYKYQREEINTNIICTDSSMALEEQIFFKPQKLKHLSLLQELNNFSCISDLKVADLAKEGNPQIYICCAAGNRSTLRVLRHGLEITQLANTNLQAKPLGIWTLKERYEDPVHKYIVISYINKTLVLKIGEKVEQVHDTGLEGTKQTIHVGTLIDDSQIQILTNGYRHIRKNKPPTDYIIDGKVIKGVSNEKQVAFALAGGDVYYFELDTTTVSGNLIEITKDQMDNEIKALELGPIEEGRQRCKFLCVALSDQTIRLLSLEPESCFERGAMQALPSEAESLCMMEMASEQEGQQSFTKQLFLFIGLNNGLLMRTSVDQLSGGLSDTRTRYLGTKAVKCLRITANQQQAMLALSSRSWLCYNNSGRIFMQPLSYDYLDYASAFLAKEFQGIVGTNQSTLRIIMPERFGEIFNQQSLDLTYSPRKMIFHEPSKAIFIIESDNRSYNNIQQKVEEVYQTEELPEQWNQIQAEQYKWASLIRIVDATKLETLNVHQFYENQHACSICYIQFAGYQEQYICVGTVKDLVNEPSRKFSQGFIHTFIYDNKTLKLKHSTPIDEIPYALAAWRGRLLVGAGCNLRVYEMGNQRILKKAEIKNLNSFITSIMVKEDRIYVAEVADSIHLLRYNIRDQTFMELADDILPRYVTASTVLDYHTVIAGDKFENIFVSRVPLDIDEEQEEHPYEYKMKMDQGCMNGAPFKMDQICNFYVGEVITSLQKIALVSTSSEVVVYGTSMGSIAALYPFDNKEDIDFFLHLEMYLRVEHQPLSGRDHMQFRSAYGPCKSIIDGDLCDQFGNMQYNKQRAVAEEFDRTPADIIKKLEDIRNKIL
ncbi:unnamed protein product [Paramecium pentaurelia]|uniref:Splicing factor 3B subunit 3 n=1 Tax=Paramecium pentaurelia TaxID=43138 RepID=A0A8S1TSH3_9CILI|nr:unnamed protein product [Paramecium pentaurelia]